VHGSRSVGRYPVNRSLIFEADESQDGINIYRTHDVPKNAFPIASIATYGGPYGMAMDKAGTLYVAQYYAWTVSEYPKGSTTAKTVISDGLHAPDGVAVDRHGTLFVSNNAGWISVYPYGATSPSMEISGGGMTHPAGIALDKNGNLFIADIGTQKVFEIIAGTNTVTQLQLADLNQPIGIAIDLRSGDTWVTNGNGINIYPPGAQYPSRQITGLYDAYALSIQNNGRPKDAAVLADPNRGCVYFFAPGQYTTYTSFDNGMQQPVGVLIEKP